MEGALASEKVWVDKYKYEDAENMYYEHLAKLLNSDGVKNKSSLLKTNLSYASAPVIPKNNILISIPDPNNYTTSSEPCIKDKRFKVKNRNKTKKETEKRTDKPIKQELMVHLNGEVTKNSLAEEVAKARQHIKNSLDCVDGIAKLTTDSLTVDINSRINSLESESNKLKTDVKNLIEVVTKLIDRIGGLDNLSNGSQVKAPEPKPKVEDDDDAVDLFGSDSDAEDKEAKKVKEQRLAEYAARKSKKPALIAKSNIILDVKPWDDNTDMKQMEENVRKVTTDGLIWGASKLVPLAYGIHKLQISCVVEDDKVSVDWLQEQLEAIEDYVQSVDIAAFNKV